MDLSQITGLADECVQTTTVTQIESRDFKPAVLCTAIREVLSNRRAMAVTLADGFCYGGLMGSTTEGTSTSGCFVIPQLPKYSLEQIGCIQPGIGCQ